MAEKKQRKPYHEMVAEKIIAQLEQGVAPWQRPWDAAKTDFGVLPVNPISGKRYKGVNALYLMAQGHDDPRWMTYNQAQGLGAQVRKGETGTPVQYWKFTEEQTKLDSAGNPVLDADKKPVKETIELERPRVFFATVFNASQIDGLPPLERSERPERWKVIDTAERIITASGAELIHSESNQAFYRAVTDTVHMPNKDQFPTAEHYYATALHELGHWTGHSSRLGRDLRNPFGSEEYAKEELRAEIASMMLADQLGIGHDPKQHAAYVQSWIQVLNDDPLEIFRAAADAEKIQAYIMAFQQELQQDVSATTTILAAKESLNAETNMRTSDNEVRERIYIDVGYKEKEEAKRLGARWDRDRESWYVPPAIDSSLFAKWMKQQQPSNDTHERTERPVRTYLAVPYGERNAAKAAGAQWDIRKKSWYVDQNADLSGVARWLPDAQPQQGPAKTPRDEFADLLSSLNCVVTGAHPVMDGKTHRIKVAGDREKEESGFYVGHLDGHPAGYAKNNRSGVDVRWKSKGYTLTDNEKAQLQADTARKLEERERLESAEHNRVAANVQRELTTLKPVSEPTPYMVHKGIAPGPFAADIFTDTAGQKTYIPARDAAGTQWTTQYVQDDGTKRFAKNGRKEGCFHILGGGGLKCLKDVPAIVIGEGFATAHTGAKAINFATVSAFDSGNLMSVAKTLRMAYPGKPIVIMGDDDKHLHMIQGINTGKSKAEEAAAAVGGIAVFPVFGPGEGVYPSALPPITPAAYKKHIRAEATLNDSPGLSIQERKDLQRDLLSDAQLNALNSMKGFTDFNDVERRSVLGIDSVARQLSVAVEQAIEKQQKALQKNEQILEPVEHKRRRSI